MVALQLFPIIVEMITRGAVGHLRVAAVSVVLYAILCEGELSVLAWMPLIFMWALLWGTSEERESRRCHGWTAYQPHGERRPSPPIKE
jgi:hypothetical protein